MKTVNWCIEAAPLFFRHCTLLVMTGKRITIKAGNNLLRHRVVNNVISSDKITIVLLVAIILKMLLKNNLTINIKRINLSS